MYFIKINVLNISSTNTWYISTFHMHGKKLQKSGAFLPFIGMERNLKRESNEFHVMFHSIFLLQKNKLFVNCKCKFVKNSPVIIMR